MSPRIAFRFVCPLVALVLPVHVASIRASGKAAHAAPESKVRQVLTDIAENVRKEGEDAELVFATLSNYEEQFSTSLDREISMLNETLAKLSAMDSEYSLEVNSSRDELQYLGTSMQGSQQAMGAYGAGATKASKKYESLLNSVRMLTALLQAARVTPEGQLATPEAPDASGRPRRVYAAMWRLLGSQPELRTSFADVFAAFAPLPAQSQSAAPVAHLTPELLQRSIAVLREISTKMEEQKSQALLQLAGKQEQFAADAHADQLNAETQRGVQAEDEQKSAELSYSINFTIAVLKIDREFRSTLRTHMDQRLSLTRAARSSRESLLQTATALATSLEKSQPRPPPQQQAMSFLEVSASTPKSDHRKASALQTAVEDAIRNKGDTHAILMKVKGMLDQALPVDPGSVSNIVSKMGSVLHSVESEQSNADEAKMRCEAQKFHAVEEDRGLRANLGLMVAAQNHTRAAVQAAKNNLNGIVAKVEALGRSSRDFNQLVGQSLETLGGQSQDRATISAAVQKAEEVMARSPKGVPEVVNGLKKMSEEINAQEAAQRAFRGEEAAFKEALVGYATDYSSLLQDRRNHYRQSLAALDLYTNELANDVQAEQDAVESNAELVRESRQLCDSVMNFYKTHSKRRADLTAALKTVLPKVPEILSMGSQEESLGA